MPARSTSNGRGPRSTAPVIVLVALAALAALVTLAACGGGSVGPPSTEPYVLFAPVRSNVTYLMDLNGQLVHQWRSDSTPGCSVYLLPDGRLLRPRSLGDTYFPGGGCNGGRIEFLDWSGKALWTFDYNSPEHQQHHDVRYMPNGHVLLMAWEKRTAAEAMAAGREAATHSGERGDLGRPPRGGRSGARTRSCGPGGSGTTCCRPGPIPPTIPELIDPNAWATPHQRLDPRERHRLQPRPRPGDDQRAQPPRDLGHRPRDHDRRGGGPHRRPAWQGRRPPLPVGQPAELRLPGCPAALRPARRQLDRDPGFPGQARSSSSTTATATPGPTRRWSRSRPRCWRAGSTRSIPQTGFLPTRSLVAMDGQPADQRVRPIVSSAQRLPSGNTLVCDGPAGHFFEVTTAGRHRVVVPRDRHERTRTESSCSAPRATRRATRPSTGRPCPHRARSRSR